LPKIHQTWNAQSSQLGSRYLPHIDDGHSIILGKRIGLQGSGCLHIEHSLTAAGTVHRQRECAAV
jgi:hypothetical protein